MLLEVLKQDKFLTAAVIAVGALWLLVFLRNIWRGNKKAGEFQQTYDHILNAEEYKVKGRFEESR